jgi:hypothetical protein
MKGTWYDAIREATTQDPLYHYIALETCHTEDKIY